MIKRYADQQVLLVGNFTGAQPQRESSLRRARVQRPGVLPAGDVGAGRALLGDRRRAPSACTRRPTPTGRSGTDGVAPGAGRRAEPARRSRRPIRRGAKFEVRHGPGGQRALRRAGVDVVLCTGAYQGCGAFVRTARDSADRADLQRLVRGPDAMLRLLIQHGKATGRDHTRALVNSQVVPSYDDVSLPGVVEYRALMERRSPAVPPALRDDEVHAADLQLHQPRRVHQRAGHRGGAAAGRSESHARSACGRRWSRSRTSTSASARRSTSAPSATRVWTACTSPVSMASAGFRSPTGRRPCRHERFRGSGMKSVEAEVRAPGEDHPVPGGGADPAGRGDLADLGADPADSA